VLGDLLRVVGAATPREHDGIFGAVDRQLTNAAGETSFDALQDSLDELLPVEFDFSEGDHRNSGGTLDGPQQRAGLAIHRIDHRVSLHASATCTKWSSQEKAEREAKAFPRATDSIIPPTTSWFQTIRKLLEPHSQIKVNLFLLSSRGQHE
jgi:hypothetical protein